MNYEEKKILITGGTGFFGRALLRYWIEQSKIGIETKKIFVLSRNPTKFIKDYPEFLNYEWLNFIEGDILSPIKFDLKYEFDYILHAAADSTLGPQLTCLERYIQIVEGTRNLLNYAVENKVERFLFVSSGGVYGPQNLNMLSIPEDYNGMPDPLVPNNSYSVAKRSAEHLSILYREQFGIEIVIARCFAFVGKDMPFNAHFAIGNFIRDALYKQEIYVKGDGQSVRTYLDQRDLARWLDKILINGKDGEAYNVGSDYPITIANLANLVRETISPSKKVIIMKQDDSNNFRSIYIPNINKARNELELDIEFSLKKAIIDAVDFYE